MGETGEKVLECDKGMHTECMYVCVCVCVYVCVCVCVCKCKKVKTMSGCHSASDCVLDICVGNI